MPYEPAGFLQAGGNESHRDQQRLHDVPCGGGKHGHGFLRCDAAAAGIRTHSQQRGLRDMPRIDVQVRSRHADEPHASRRDSVRDLPRDRQELHRRDDRDASDSGTGCGGASTHRRLRGLAIRRRCRSRPARVTGKPANHIPTTQTCTLCHTSLRLVQTGGDEPRRHRQRLHDVPRRRRQREQRSSA